MEKLPALTGWRWVQQGFALFRKQPLEMSTLFLSYMFLMLVVSIIPLLGQLLPILLVPVFSMVFMQACMHIEQGKKVTPALLLYGLQLPTRQRLLILGALYLGAATLAILASTLVDDGLLWRLLSGAERPDPETMRGSGISQAMLFSAVLYLPALMAFWYAAPLISWKNMGLGKALFYSFFAVKRNGKAFILFGLAWLMLGVFLPVFISTLATLVLGQTFVMGLIMLPLSLLLTVVMYCSFYPTYTSVFGNQDGNESRPGYEGHESHEADKTPDS